MQIGFGTNLQQLTGSESGIIIYPDSQALLINWYALHAGGIPRLLDGTVIALSEELQVLETKELSRNEIKSIVADIKNNLTIVSDTDDTLTPEDVTSDGIMYKIESNGEIFTVITVDDWN